MRDHEVCWDYRLDPPEWQHEAEYESLTAILEEAADEVRPILRQWEEVGIATDAEMRDVLDALEHMEGEIPEHLQDAADDDYLIAIRGIRGAITEYKTTRDPDLLDLVL